MQALQAPHKVIKKPIIASDSGDSDGELTLIYNIVYTTDNKFIVYTAESGNEGENNGENNVNKNYDGNHDEDSNENHNEDNDEDRNEDIDRNKDIDENHNEDNGQHDNENDGSYSVLKFHQMKNGIICPPSR